MDQPFSAPIITPWLKYFCTKGYPDDPAYPFSVSLVGENVVRLRTTCRSGDLLENRDAQSLMLDGAPESLPLAPVEADGSYAVYRTTKLEVEVQYEPFM